MRRITTKFIVASGFVGLALVSTRPVHALCGQTQANVSVSEQSLFVLRPCATDPQNRDPNYYPNWHWVNMHIDPRDWIGRFGDFCDIKLDYPKEVNASWLVAALPHLPPPPPPNLIVPLRAFHGHDDYGPAIDGNDTDWHDELKHRIIDGYGPPPGLTLGVMETNPVSINELQTFCTLYDWNEPLIFPPGSCGPIPCIGRKGTNLDFVSIRASTIVHEGWHAWGEENLNSVFASNLTPLGHEFSGPTDPVLRGLPGFCSNAVECDRFRPHRSNEFPEGQLINAGRHTDAHTGDDIPSRSTYHSVYQTQIEFDCDIADYSPDFMPYSVREMSAAWAKIESTTAVVEFVPFFCGSTRPFWTRDPGAIPDTTVPPCLDKARKDCGLGTNGNCGMGFHGCGPDGCCVPSCSDPNPSKQCTGLGTSGYSCGTQCNPLTGCCVAPPQPLKVSASTTQQGPDICIHGEGFTPGSMVQVQYLNVPGKPFPAFANFPATVASDGSFDMKDASQEQAVVGCTSDQANGQVQVQAVENNSIINSIATLPADLWCASSPPKDINGGCR